MQHAFNLQVYHNNDNNIIIINGLNVINKGVRLHHCYQIIVFSQFCSCAIENIWKLYMICSPCVMNYFQMK